MLRNLLLRRSPTVVIAAVTVTLFAAPAAAAPEPTPGRRASDVNVARALAPCDPSGPTSTDAALAVQLNSSLQAKMRGFMSAYRVSCARMVVNAVKARGLHSRAAVIAITTTIVESSIDNISEELDHDSLGLFQQRASWGNRTQRLDPTWATNAFLNKMLNEYPNNTWMTAPVGEVCQTVQVSAFPERYQPQAGDGQIIVNALWSVPPADDGSVQFADVDGDGLAELVQVRSNGDVVAYRNLGWDAARVYDSGQNKLVATGFTRALEVKFEDLDGDGLAELVQVRSNGDVVAYRNLGWNAARVYDSGQNKLVATGFSDPVSTKFADVDGDGLGELVQVRSNGDVVAYRNLGWNAARVYDSGQNKLVATGFTDPVSTKFADVDNDGRVELVQVRSNDDVVAYRNLGWNAARVYDSGQNKLVATGFTDPVRTKFGDLNGDPAGAEIISIRPNGDVVAYRNLGWNAPKVYDGAESKLVATGFTI